MKKILDIHELMLQANPIYAQDPDILAKMEDATKRKVPVKPKLRQQLNGAIS